MTRVSTHLLLLSLIFVILLYERVESKRSSSSGRSSSSRGSSGSRSSSRSSSSGSKSSWFGSSSKSSSGKSSWGGGSSRSSSHSWGSGGHSYGSSSYGGYGSGIGGYGSSNYRGSYSPSYPSGRSWSDRYYGNTFLVTRSHTYFGGGGYGRVYTSSNGKESSRANEHLREQMSESPTVTTEMIRDALFPGDPRMPAKEIFEYNESSMRMLTDQTKKDNNHDMSRAMLEGMIVGTQARLQREGKTNDGQLETLKKMKKILSGEGANVVHLKEETQPVLVGSIPYFWRETNLPQGDNDTDCTDFSPVNDASNFTICNVTSLIRCHKSLAEVVVVGKKARSFMDPGLSFSYDADNKVDVKIEIKTADGRIAEEFSWFCPATDRCCEWECCSTLEKEYTEFHPPDQNVRLAVVFLIFMVIIITIVSVAAICCKYFNKKIKDQRKERRKLRNREIEQIERREAAAQRQRQQQMRERRTDEEERQPLTASGAPQPSQYPASASYGWSQIPSAPPEAPPSYQEAIRDS